MSRSINKLLCALALIAMGFVAAPASAHSSAEELAEETLTLVNLIRQRLADCREQGDIGKADLQNAAFTANARPSLNWNPKLAAVAARHGANMVLHRFFDHVDPQGTTIGKRASAAGYQWKVVGENLAAGHDNLAEAMRGWLQSVTHCRNLIDARFTEIGIARVSSRDEYGTYWVMVLGKPQPTEQKLAPMPRLAANAAAATSRLLAALN